MRNEANVNALAALCPDFMGFIFYPPSKRFVGLAFDKNLISKLPDQIIKTGVFVNAQVHEVIEFSKLYGFKAVQLHGDETPEFCQKIKGEGFIVLKAFGLDDDFDFDSLKAYEAYVDYFLFDTKVDTYGGSGQTFDWTILDSYLLDQPFFLSGGVSLDNLESIKEINHQKFYGLDLNSKFEIEPGLKNIEKLALAFSLIKKL